MLKVLRNARQKSMCIHMRRCAAPQCVYTCVYIYMCVYMLKVLSNTDAVAQAEEEGLPLLRGAGVSGYK